MRDVIRSLVDLGSSHAIQAGLDSVFFGASTQQAFASPQARSAFRDLWLGSYLEHNNSEVFVALGDDDEVLGYIVGALADPAHDGRFNSLGYFRDFAPLTQHYPAHLHINVATQHRSRGLGARLLRAFCEHAGKKGAPGVHVVTGQGMRNVGFYLANGFEELAQSQWNGRTVVMLGRSLSG